MEHIYNCEQPTNGKETAEKEAHRKFTQAQNEETALFIQINNLFSVHDRETAERMVIESGLANRFSEAKEVSKQALKSWLDIIDANMSDELDFDDKETE